MTAILDSHLWLDGRGVAWIDDTNVKVIEVALDHTSGTGLGAEEIHRAHNGYLSLSQIHAALAYYYDHQPEMDAEIARQVAEFDEQRSASADSPLPRSRQ